MSLDCDCHANHGGATDGKGTSYKSGTLLLAYTNYLFSKNHDKLNWLPLSERHIREVWLAIKLRSTHHFS